MDSLKDALEKAGFKINERDQKSNKPQSSSHKLRKDDRTNEGRDNQSRDASQGNRPYRDNRQPDNRSYRNDGQSSDNRNNQGNNTSRNNGQSSDNRNNQGSSTYRNNGQSSDNRNNQGSNTGSYRNNNEGSNTGSYRNNNEGSNTGSYRSNNERNERPERQETDRSQRYDRSARMEQDRDERPNKLPEDGNYRHRDIPKDAIPREDRKFLDQEKRPAKPNEGFGRVHTHHLIVVCEACNKTSPDVEYYDHTIRNLKARWLCIPCADNCNIHDKFRQTAQSDFSLRRCFRRLWGPTMKYIRRENTPILDVENDG